MMQTRERIVILDEGTDLLRETVVREPAPMLALMPIFHAVGPGRGEWEAAQAANEVHAEYIAPRSAA